MKRINQIVIAAVLVFLLHNATWAQRGGRGEAETNVRGQRQSANPARNPQQFTGVDAKMEYYESKMDGKKRPYGVCNLGPDDQLKPLVVLVQPGLTSNPNPEGMLRSIREFGSIAKKYGKSCVFMRPTGRGPGSRFQNYGEVDVLEAIEDVCEKYPVDRDRISVFGHSMGGCATWYLAAHYPDLFSCAVPLAGYCDYRLWAKTGGLTYHMHEFEQPSWEARSAPFIVENFEHTPVWIWHGERDRALGGGVPVYHASQMAEKLQ